MKSESIMRSIAIDKVSVNINVGNDKLKMDRAKLLIETLTKKKPKYTTAKKRIATWSIRPGLPIGYLVTLRGQEAKDFLALILKARNLEFKQSCFDNNGNFSFGIAEYLDIPGLKYNASIGVLGFEVMVTLTRPGFRIKKRSFKQTKVPLRHRITKDEAIAFIKSSFGEEVFA